MKENGGKVYVCYGCIRWSGQPAHKKMCDTECTCTHPTCNTQTHTHTHWELCAELFHFWPWNFLQFSSHVVVSCIFHALVFPVEGPVCPREDFPLLQGHVLHQYIEIKGQISNVNEWVDLPFFLACLLACLLSFFLLSLKTKGYPDGCKDAIWIIGSSYLNWRHWFLLQVPECTAHVSRCAGDAAAFKYCSGPILSDSVNLSCHFQTQVGYRLK